MLTYQNKTANQIKIEKSLLDEILSNWNSLSTIKEKEQKEINVKMEDFYIEVKKKVRMEDFYTDIKPMSKKKILWCKVYNIPASMCHVNEENEFHVWNEI